MSNDEVTMPQKEDLEVTRTRTAVHESLSLLPKSEMERARWRLEELELAVARLTIATLDLK